MIDQYDFKEGYCRKLGHYLPFHYCRQLHQGLPCPSIRDCWFEHLPIQEFLKSHFSPEELARIDTPPQGKLESILNIVFSLREATGSDTHCS